MAREGESLIPVQTIRQWGVGPWRACAPPCARKAVPLPGKPFRLVPLAVTLAKALGVPLSAWASCHGCDHMQNALPGVGKGVLY